MSHPINRRRAVLVAATAAAAAVAGSLDLSVPDGWWSRVPATPAEIALGIFEPGAPGDPAVLDAVADQIGRMPAFVHWYEAWGSELSRYSEWLHVERLDAVSARGAVPMITWEPWVPSKGPRQPEYRPAAIAAGEYDAYLRTWAEPIADWGKPVFLRMFHELNAEWYPWGAVQPYNTPEDLVAAWRHVWEVFHEAGATNVRWVWCADAGLGKVALDRIYPGDEYVDWAALDGYNWGMQRPESGWRSFDDIFSVAYRALVELSDRPVMISETASVELGGDKAAWIADTFAAIPERYPQVRALAWFNEKQRDGNFPVSSSPEALESFRTAIALPGYQAPLEPVEGL
jgi:hypothetical protein